MCETILTLVGCNGFNCGKEIVRCVWMSCWKCEIMFSKLLEGPCNIKKKNFSNSEWNTDDWSNNDFKNYPCCSRFVTVKSCNNVLQCYSSSFRSQWLVVNCNYDTTLRGGLFDVCQVPFPYWDLHMFVEVLSRVVDTGCYKRGTAGRRSRYLHTVWKDVKRWKTSFVTRQYKIKISSPPYACSERPIPVVFVFMMKPGSGNPNRSPEWENGDGGAASVRRKPSV